MLKTKVESKPLVVTVKPIKTTPKSDFLSKLPESWRPYVELTRFQKPAGLFGFYFPYLIGIFFAASIADPAPSWAWVGSLMAIYLMDCVLLRSFGCAWNDTVDQDLDRQVARCKNRPLARGAVSTTGAVTLTAVLTAMRMGMIYALLPLPATYHALLTTTLGYIYPFMKRVSNYPQVCLGIAVGWAIFQACASVDGIGDLIEGPNTKAIAAMFASTTLWNVTYDTVYAFQDLKDDLQAGVMSLAVRIRHHAKAVLSLFTTAMIGLLFAAGALAEFSTIFFIGATLASLAAYTMLFKLDINDPKSCCWFFVMGQWYVSGFVLMGLVGEFALAV
ncbi:putative UbiA family prenyltransferase [Phyllosticta citribraziliensis]|uniref:UbiA family prenyltransferase n=1 Tax=Phyllosticta citribraziliensis TaxID=989973 RepID=A0ABR1M1U3_9PEZI